MQFVLVHGVVHGAWCWERTITDLEAAGNTAIALDLPLTGLEDDARAVTDALDELDGPVVLVGHSYGGQVISKAGAGRSDVEHLVYVAAVMLEPDQAFAEVAAEHPTPLVEHTVVHDDGTFTVSTEGAIESFYGRCDDGAARLAASRLRPTALACLMTAAGSAAWKAVPSTYVLCTEDKAISPTLQAVMSQRATEVVELTTDHSPFLSTPDELLEILTTAAGGVSDG